MRDDELLWWAEIEMLEHRRALVRRLRMLIGSIDADGVVPRDVAVELAEFVDACDTFRRFAASDVDALSGVPVARDVHAIRPRRHRTVWCFHPAWGSRCE